MLRLWYKFQNFKMKSKSITHIENYKFTLSKELKKTHQRRVKTDPKSRVDQSSWICIKNSKNQIETWYKISFKILTRKKYSLPMAKYLMVLRCFAVRKKELFCYLNVRSSNVQRYVELGVSEESLFTAFRTFNFLAFWIE